MGVIQNSVNTAIGLAAATGYAGGVPESRQLKKSIKAVNEHLESMPQNTPSQVEKYVQSANLLAPVVSGQALKLVTKTGSKYGLEKYLRSMEIKRDSDEVLREFANKRAQDQLATKLAAKASQQDWIDTSMGKIYAGTPLYNRIKGELDG